MAFTVKGGGALPIDNNHKPIQVGYNQTPEDASGTPKTSPLTVSSSALELVPPDNSLLLTIRATVADIRVGDNVTMDGTLGDGYGFIPAGTAKEIDVADGASVWVLRDAAVDATAYFEFTRTTKK